MQTPARRFPSSVLIYLGLGLCAILAVWLASYVPNADWYGTFDAAGRGILEGRSPYDQPLFSNPPWTALILLPFVLLRPALARGLVFVASLASIGYTAWRLRAPKLALIAVLLSPTTVGALLAANLDALAVPGIFLPPAWGLLLLLIKPQVGAGVAVFYLVDSWHRKGFAGVLRTFAPLAVLTVLGALLFPVWIQRLAGSPAIVWNRSLFPYAIPLAVFLLWMAVRNRNPYFALASTAFFSPYLSFYTYIIVQIGLLHEDVERYIRRDVLQIILCIFLWAIMLIFRL